MEQTPQHSTSCQTSYKLLGLATADQRPSKRQDKSATVWWISNRSGWLHVVLICPNCAWRFINKRKNNLLEQFSINFGSLESISIPQRLPIRSYSQVTLLESHSLPVTQSCNKRIWLLPKNVINVSLHIPNNNGWGFCLCLSSPFGGNDRSRLLLGESIINYQYTSSKRCWESRTRSSLTSSVVKELVSTGTIKSLRFLNGIVQQRAVGESWPWSTNAAPDDDGRLNDYYWHGWKFDSWKFLLSLYYRK